MEEMVWKRLREIAEENDGVLSVELVMKEPDESAVWEGRGKVEKRAWAQLLVVEVALKGVNGREWRVHPDAVVK